MILNAKTIAALTLPDGKSDVIHFDGDLPGFGFRLRAAAGGKLLRSFVCQYRRAGGSRRVLLGSAEVLSAGQAREAARAVLAKVALGQDPQGDKAARRDKDRISLRSVVADYLPTKQTEVGPKTLQEITRYLTGPYFKLLHAMPLDAVTQRDVATCLLAIVRDRGKVTGRAARSTLSAFYVWAMQQGLVGANPVIGTRRAPEALPRERVLTDPELIAIWNACHDNQFGKIIRLLVLTGCRRTEVGGMCWSELDLERGLFTLPSTRSKNGRPLILPLPAMALDIIGSVPRMAGRDQLFGERAARGFSYWHEHKRLLDARSGVSGWTIHDVRRSVATKMADIGVAPHVVEAVLNHQSGHRAGVAGIYNRSSYEREVRAALALWADHVRTLVEGGERKVVPLRANAE